MLYLERSPDSGGLWEVSRDFLPSTMRTSLPHTLYGSPPPGISGIMCPYRSFISLLEGKPVYHPDIPLSNSMVYFTNHFLINFDQLSALAEACSPLIGVFCMDVYRAMIRRTCVEYNLLGATFGTSLDIHRPFSYLSCTRQTLCISHRILYMK